MSSHDGERDAVPPDEAFALIGDETRLRILRELGRAEAPLAFSTLRDRVGVADSGQFNYHLERLVGHFVGKGDDGYRLRRAGRRVVEAVLSGAVTGTPTLPRTRVDESCEHCGAPVEIERDGGSIALYCTSCAGRYDRVRGERDAPAGYLGRLPFPPAGGRGRSPEAVLRAAWTWGNLELLAISAGLCPRCGTDLDRSLSICESHDADDGLCASCGGRYAVGVGAACPNCIFEGGGLVGIALVATTPLLDFLTDHGYNPVAPDSTRRIRAVTADYGETVLSRDPLRVRLTFAAGDETLALTVDDDLGVVEATRR